MTEQEALDVAFEVRTSRRMFVDVPAADRPLVAAALSKLTDAKMQELYGGRRQRTGFGTAQHSRVG